MEIKVKYTTFINGHTIAQQDILTIHILQLNSFERNYLYFYKEFNNLNLILSLY